MTDSKPHLMMRDPFKKAIAIEVSKPKDSVLGIALAKLAPEGTDFKNTLPLIVSRASLEKSIIDATVSGSCCVCKNDVWLSPSSKVSMKEEKDKTFLMFCTNCVLAKMKELGSDKGIFDAD